MNIVQLKMKIDHAIEQLRDYENPEDIKVLITLAEPSVGGRAAADIVFAGLGFDWEKGQFRLEPSNKLVRQGRTYSDINPPYETEIEGRKYLFCSRCGGGSRVAKDDRYCRSCGQRLR